MALTFNPSSRLAETGRSLRVLGQPALHRETLPQNTKHKVKEGQGMADGKALARHAKVLGSIPSVTQNRQISLSCKTHLTADRTRAHSHAFISEQLPRSSSRELQDRNLYVLCVYMVYVCVCICAHVCCVCTGLCYMHACTCACIHVCGVHTCACVVCVHACMHACRYLHVYMCVLCVCVLYALCVPLASNSGIEPGALVMPELYH